MANNEELFKKIIAHAKEYGFVFPSSEIYDGLSAVYDYGQYGVELKNNISIILLLNCSFFCTAKMNLSENLSKISGKVWVSIRWPLKRCR